MLGRICTVQIQARTHAPDHAGYTALARPRHGAGSKQIRNACSLRDLARPRHGAGSIQIRNACSLRDLARPRHGAGSKQIRNACSLRDLARPRHGAGSKQIRNACSLRDLDHAAGTDHTDHLSEVWMVGVNTSTRESRETTRSPKYRKHRADHPSPAHGLQQIFRGR